MARNRLRRKRVKEESDVDELVDGPSTTVGGPAKRRRTIAETSSIPPTSSPNIEVATRRVTRQACVSNALAPKAGTSTTTNSEQIRVKLEDEVSDTLQDVKPKVEAISPSESVYRRQQGPPDTSTSTLSDLSTASDAKSRSVKEEVDDPDVKTSDKENDFKSTGTNPKILRNHTDQVKPTLRDLKGKGRATTPSGLQDLPNHNTSAESKIAVLQAELASLRRDLQAANTQAANDQTFKTQISEAITCNICLEALHHPVVLLCGHAFCQNDLWNWFHRQPDEGETDSDASSNSDEHDDSESPSSGDEAHPPQSSLLPPTRRRLHGSQSEILPVEDDYDTDPSSDEQNEGSDSTGLSRSASPVAVRSGLRLVTTRGEQVAAQQRMRRRLSTTPLDTADLERPPTADSPEVDHAAIRNQLEGRPARVPALSRPRRRNLVCPQCRSQISLPPFPVFMLQDLANLVSGDTGSHASASTPNAESAASMRDPTWGGLFPRVARSTRGPGASNEHRRHYRSSSEPTSSASRSSESLEPSNAPGPSSRNQPRDGLHRRQEGEYSELVMRGYSRRLAQLERSRDARRRSVRASRAAEGNRHASTPENEALLRSEEDRAIAEARRLLLESRANHPGPTARRRDILRHGLVDAEDGVRRCIDCHWEIENGQCQHCGMTYDSDSEYDERGDDLNGEGPTSPTHDGSDLSFVEPDPQEVSDAESAAVTESEAGDRDRDQDALARQSRRSGPSIRNEPRGRKRSQYLYDSEERDLADQAGADVDDDDGFFVSDNGSMSSAENREEDRINESTEAESTDRDLRKRHREERRQARAAHALQQHGYEDGEHMSTVDSDDAESSTEKSDSDDTDNPVSGSSQSDISEDVTDDQGDIPMIASQEVRRGMLKRPTGSAREEAAQAAIRRNTRPAAYASEADMQELFRARVTNAGGGELFHASNDNLQQVPGRNVRRKRIIAASDEE